MSALKTREFTVSGSKGPQQVALYGKSSIHCTLYNILHVIDIRDK